MEQTVSDLIATLHQEKNQLQQELNLSRELVSQIYAAYPGSEIAIKKWVELVQQNKAVPLKSLIDKPTKKIETPTKK